MVDVTNKVFVITGGSQGIGKCMVEYLSGLKAHVWFLDQKKEEGEQIIHVLRNPKIRFIPCDLSDKKELDIAIRTIVSSGLNIDVLIHNAAFSSKGLETSDYDGFDQTMKVNVTAPFYLTQQLIPYFNAGGSVIHIASTRAFQSQKDSESYTASKGALIAMTHAMMRSLEGRIRVNSISPGWIDTSSCEKKEKSFTEPDHTQHPSKKIGSPMDVIRAVLFLSDPRNDFINGENLIIDGGMTKTMIYHQDEGWSFKG